MNFLCVPLPAQLGASVEMLPQHHRLFLLFSPSVFLCEERISCLENADFHGPDEVSRERAEGLSSLNSLVETTAKVVVSVWLDIRQPNGRTTLLCSHRHRQALHRRRPPVRLCPSYVLAATRRLLFPPMRSSHR